MPYACMMGSHGYHRSVIFVLFFLYFGSTGFPSVIKLSLTSGSTTWGDFSSRTTITFAENPDFEIGLELNSPFEFCTAYSTNNTADSLHRKLLSYRQNRNDEKIYSSVRVAILTLVRKFKRGKPPCAYYSNSSATFYCMLEDDLVFKLNPGPTNNDDQSTISSHCSRGLVGAALRCLHGQQSFSITPNAISYPESSGFLVSGGDAGRDSGIMEFLSQKIWDSGFSAHALMFRNGSQIFQKGRHCRERENRQES